MWSAGVGVSIPLWAGEKQRPLIVEAESLFESASATEASLRRQIEARDRGEADPDRAARRRSEARRRGNPRPGPALGRRRPRQLPDRLRSRSSPSSRRSARTSATAARPSARLAEPDPRRGRPRRVLPRAGAASAMGPSSPPASSPSIASAPEECRKRHEEELASLLLVAARTSSLRSPVVLALAGCRKTVPVAEAAKKYQCPMHPEIVQGPSGRLPDLRHEARPDRDGAADRSRKPASAETKILFYRSPMNPRRRPRPKKDSMGMDFVPSTRTRRGARRARGPRDRHDRRRKTAAPRAEDRRGHAGSRSRPRSGRWDASPPTSGGSTTSTRGTRPTSSTSTADFTGKYVRKGERPGRRSTAPTSTPRSRSTSSRSRPRARSPGPRFRRVSQGGQDLLDAARQRLLLWEISPEDIDAGSRRSGEPLRTLDHLRADLAASSRARTAYHGMKVMPADTLFDIVDLSARLGPRGRLRVRAAAPLAWARRRR